MERSEETSIPAVSLAQKASLKTERWSYVRQKKGQKDVSRPLVRTDCNPGLPSCCPEVQTVLGT